MSNKTALVTGAGGGIGQEACKQLQGQGYLVYATDINLEAMQSLSPSDTLRLVKLDVTSESNIAEAVETVKSEVGSLDLLVSNAGYAQLGALECVPIELAQRELDVNVFGVARVLRGFLPMMRERRSGRIIMMSSIVGKISMPGYGWYAASKHALEAMSDALREELRPFGIGVSIIEPGTVATAFIDKQVDTLKNVDQHDDYQFVVDAAIKAAPPGGKGATAESIARAVVAAAEAASPPVRIMLPAQARLLASIRKWGGDAALNRLFRSAFKMPDSV